MKVVADNATIFVPGMGKITAGKYRETLEAARVKSKGLEFKKKVARFLEIMGEKLKEGPVFAADLKAVNAQLKEELDSGNFVYISGSKLGVHTKNDELPYNIAKKAKIVVFPPVYGG